MDLAIEIIGRHLKYNENHIASVATYKLRLPSGFVWTANDSRERVVDKPTAVAWGLGTEKFSHRYDNGTSEEVKVSYFVHHGGCTVVASVYHWNADKSKTASTGWLQTAADGVTADNIILGLPDCGE